MSAFVSTDFIKARPPGAVELNRQRAVAVPTTGDGGSRHANYSVVVIVVVLSVVFILSGFLHLLARCLGQRRRRQLVTPQQRSHRPQLVSALHGQLQHLFHLHDAGVEQAFISTLPVFAYGSIRGLKDSTDCAVCLTEFADDDRLRLLPKCKHAFHLECIDTWLLSHSTCPLCRHSLLAPSSSSHHHHTGDDHHHTGAPTTELMPTSASDITRLPCSELQYPQLSTSRTSGHITTSSSVHGSSYHNSFRIGEPALPSDLLNSESTATHATQEIEELIEAEAHDNLQMSSPDDVAPTIRVVDEHGTERILKVELGKARILPTRKLTEPGARSYSMGSYEYIVDATKWPELTIAPTPYPGRRRRDDWAPTKPSHRSALSDSIPELASSPELFWTSRGVFTPHSRSRVRSALLTPIASSPASSQFLDLSCSSPGDRWIDIDLERGGVIDPGRRLSTSGRSSPALREELAPDVMSFKQRSSSLGRIGSSQMATETGCRRSLSEKLAGRETAAMNSEAKSPVTCDGNGQQPGSGTSRKFSLNWLMGRDQRIVFSAASPSPAPDTV